MNRLLIFVLLLNTLLLSGQSLFDSTQVGVVKGGDNTYYDTVLNISSYHRFNDYGFDDFGLISMGNQGDIRRRLILKPYSDVKPNLGMDGYFKNFSKEDGLPYYNVRVPSGGIRLLTGYEKGQLFGLHFAINPISRLNVFIDFQRINSRGNYFNQENKSDQLLVSSSYYTKNGLYKVNGGLQWNKAKNLEWGGIADTLDFQENLFTNRELIPVQLLQSASVARQLRLTLDQQLGIVNSKTSELNLFHNIMASSQSHSFKSADSSFVIDAVFQESPIRDSIRFSGLEHYTGLKWNFKRDSLDPNNNQVLIIGAKLYSTVYGNQYSLQVENNVGVSATYRGHHKLYFWGASGNLLFTNEFAGSNDLDIHFGKSFANNSHFLVSASTQSAVPGQFYQRYYSNNFIWDNEFERIRRASLWAKVKLKNLSLQIGAYALTNYVYFNQKALPTQIKETFGIYFAEGQGTIPLFANFYLDSRIRYQYASNTDVIRIPNWIIREVFYFERDIFSKAARLQTGIEFNYFSSFTSEAYMPATSMMYLQDDINIGNYPYFNFLFNFKIKEFTFFLRLENITQGLFKYNYYAAPYYPLPDFSFRIGATWRFFN